MTYILVEADEYDRSFLNLNPNYAVLPQLKVIILIFMETINPYLKVFNHLEIM